MKVINKIEKIIAHEMENSDHAVVEESSEMIAVVSMSTKKVAQSSAKKVLDYLVEELKKQESLKWGDGNHCTCLSHAIWVLEGEKESEQGGK